MLAGKPCPTVKLRDHADLKQDAIFPLFNPSASLKLPRNGGGNRPVFADGQVPGTLPVSRLIHPQK
ncbi:hypothetical protein ACQHGV_08845 [Sphingomonas pseudosanguinis]|uniref:hypothetical protein n=1 Tax=Sphingomonas pseudosanguinis TaxID=413712 RepID=UPI003F8466F2